MLRARRTESARRPQLEVVEAPPAATPAATELQPRAEPKRTPHAKLPAGLLLLASVAMLWQGLSYSGAATAAPVLFAGAALGLASALLLVPRILPRLAGVVAVDKVVLAALAIGSYFLPRAGFPPDLLNLVPIATVLAMGLCWPASRTLPFASVLAVGLGHLAGAGFEPSSAAPVALAAVAAFVMSTSARHNAGAESTLRAKLDDLAADRGRLALENEARKDASEVSAAVLAAAKAFASALDPGEIADQITRGTCAHLQATGAVLLLWDEAVETFRVGAIHGRDVPGGGDLRQVEVRPDSIPTLRGQANGEVLRVEPSAVREPILMSMLRRWKSSELLGVRLHRGEQLLGLLFAARGEGQTRFSTHDCNVLAGLAVHAATALDHADLIADLQSANQLKEEFMATMSHELRTPLNVIIGYTDLQMEGAFGELPADHLDTLMTVREQALQLLELIQATLDMSRLERGLVTVDLRDVSIPQFVEQLRVQIPPAWRKPTVELNWRSEPGLPPIRTDPSKLQIILRNLIHNGLKFTQHGMVSMSVSAQPGRQRVTFVVQDSGIGIKSEHLSDIFEMFRQVPSGDAPPGGVGLGLYIVKRLAAVLGAEIEVSSAPGRGATFRIHLPLGGPLAVRG